MVWNLSSFAVLIVLAACSVSFGQSVLATANGFTFTASDLSPEARRNFEQQDKLITEHRRAVFNQWIFEELLAMEAQSRGMGPEKLQEESLAQAAKPTEVQIKAVYDGNRQSIGNRTLEEVRPQIIQYLSREASQRQLNSLFESLKAKHKFALVKDPAPPLKAAELAATIGSKQITVGDFEWANRVELYNYRAGLIEDVRADLERAISAKLLEAEAKKRGTDAGSVIAAEVTNKLKDYSDYERISLEDALQEKLLRDYGVKFTLPVLDPQILDVSADDDPSLGGPAAKVTVIAFVDFQCSACAAFSQLLKSVVSEFGSNARLVIRDFPLTQIHNNAMNAARAGFAARKQGKFFELGDMMYRNQDALDDGSLVKYAAALGMNLEQFRTDMASQAAALEIGKDVADGNAYGVNGTPAVFVNGIRLQRLSTGRLRNLIKDALK
jgi:protein-disulfide isomerase